MGELKGESLQTQAWISQFSLTTFVETGCFKGTGLYFAKRMGLKLFSCDLNDEYVKICQTKFPEAQIFTGESTKCLREMLPSIHEPTLFWLDSHFPHAYERSELVTETNNWPLFEELLVVKECKLNYEKDVIIADDIRCIEADDNPYFKDGGLPEDIVFGKGHTLQEYMDVFSDTHTVEFIQKGTGSLVWLPK